MSSDHEAAARGHSGVALLAKHHATLLDLLVAMTGQHLSAGDQLP